MQVIYETRHLAGSNRHVGLQELDGVAITDDERLKALATIGQVKPDQLEQKRWEMQLIHFYGHTQLRTSGYAGRVTMLQLPKRGLVYATVGNFTNLKALDLRRNDLAAVVGLEKLTCLMYVDLSGNRRLDIEQTIQQLANPQLTTLVQLHLSVDIQKPLVKTRELVLSKLAVKNKNLLAIDKKVVTMDERMAAYRSVLSPSELDQYRFGLAVVMDIVPFSERQGMAPQDVYVATCKQYKHEKVTRLIRLNNQGLLSNAVKLNFFVNLQELNLAKNKLTDLYAIGVTQLPQLRVLDVSDNIINYPLEELAQCIDSMPSLEVLAIHGNP